MVIIEHPFDESMNNEIMESGLMIRDVCIERAVQPGQISAARGADRRLHFGLPSIDLLSALRKDRLK